MLRNGLARPRMRRSPLRHRSGYSTPIGPPRLTRMRSILLKQQHLMLRSARLEYLGANSTRVSIARGNPRAVMGYKRLCDF